MSHVRASLNKGDMRERQSWRGEEADLSTVREKERERERERDSGARGVGQLERQGG
jgi:hypothetical protein